MPVTDYTNEDQGGVVSGITFGPRWYSNQTKSEPGEYLDFLRYFVDPYPGEGDYVRLQVSFEMDDNNEPVGAYGCYHIGRYTPLGGNDEEESLEFDLTVEAAKDLLLLDTRTRRAA